MKITSIVAAIASCVALTGTTASAGPVGVAIELSTMGWPFHNGHPASFSLEGKSVKGLYPGATKTIPLRVRNPYRFDLKVTHLAGKVTGSTKWACAPTPTNLVALPYDGTLPLTLRANQSKSIGSIPIRMPASVANACQRVTFTIKLTGTATKVNK